MKSILRVSLTSLVLGLVSILDVGSSALAQPCYSGYTYRVPIEIDNRANALLLNYEINISVNTSALISGGKMRNLGQDIRFLSGLGTDLDYWIEDGTINTSTTSIWVKVDSLSTYAKDTIYMYYGNASASPKSDAKATFRMVDEFNGSTLGSSWSTCGSGTVAQSGGKLKLTSNSSTAQVTTTSSFNAPVIVELVGVASSGGTGFLGQVNTSNNGYGVTFGSGNIQLASVSSTSCLSVSNYGGTTSSSGTGNWSFVWSGTHQNAGVSTQTQSSTNTTYSMGGQTKVVLANQGSYGTLEVDYMRVRSYAANIPSVSVGGEQNMNFTITATYGSPLCAGGVLQLGVNTVAGANYSWTGPNGFKSSLQNPQVTGVSTSDAGRYDLTVDIPSGCASKSTSVNVTISPKAVGGSVLGTQTVCSGSNSGVLSLSGHTGNVVRWDSAASATGPWVSIANTGLSQTYSNLTHSTFFRAIVANGSCSIDSSTVAKITVTAPSDGGQVTGIDTVCEGVNAGTLTVSGYTGNIIRWETSSNGNLWSNLTNKGTVQSYTNLSQTMYYRAAVQNGNCNIAYSSVGRIQVDKSTIGGSITGATTVCPDANAGWLVVSGRRGDVVRWESSLASSSLWTPIQHTNDSLSFANLKETTSFRALIRNGSCSGTVSSSTTVAVITPSSSGILSGGMNVCENSNSGKLSLTGLNGTVTKWQEKNTGGWNDISNTTTTYSWSNLTKTTSYRVIVANGGCKADTSNTETVDVSPISDGGYIDGLAAVCSGTNSIKLRAAALVGNIEEWQSSTTGYAPWTSLSGTSISRTENNLSQKTFYRTKVKSGACPAVYSAIKKVDADKASDAGDIVKSIELCEGTNYGVVKISGENGNVVNWQSTTSLSSPWQDEVNNTTRYEVQNISNTIYLRAIVKNGVCEADTSDIGSVEVSKYSRAGDVYGNKELCSQLNQGRVEVKNHLGEVLYWESSENNGANWTKHVTDLSTYEYTNLSKSRVYRAVIKSGVCPQVTTQWVSIDVAGASDAGTLQSSQTEVCAGLNDGDINVVNHVGQVANWQYKTSNSTWVDLDVQNEHLSYSDIDEETAYRVVVKNKFCDADTSESIVVKVWARANGGNITGDSEACVGVGTSNLKLNNYSGVIQSWESSTSKGNWSDLGVTTEDLLLDNTGATMFYRVVVVNGVCPVEYSEIFQHVIFPKTLAGKITGGKEVCAGENNGILELTGYNGEILGWETQDESGVWSDLGFAGDLYWFENLTNTSSYRAIVKSGACNEVKTEVVDVIVNPTPVVDFSTSNMCEDRIANFINTSTVSTGNIVGSNWTISDGSLSNKDSFDRLFQLAGWYEVVLESTTDKGCKSSLTQEVYIAETPKAFFKMNDGITQNTGCLGATITFEELVNYSNKADLDFAWDFGNGETSTLANPSISYPQSGIYNIHLEVTSRSNCMDEFDANFQVLEEIKPQIGEDMTVSLGIGTQLNATGSISYKWTPAEYLSDPEIANPIATVTETTEFVVTGTDYYGCESKDSVWIYVNEDYKIIPNNVITPDGNNENDVWLVTNIENYPDNVVSIFDRWGREIYKTEGYKNDWGATNSKGAVVMDGTYYYVIEFPEIDKVMKGAITVVKNN